MESLGLIGLMVIVVVAISAFFMPIFVYQMRNDVREIRRLLGKATGDSAAQGSAIKTCPHCKTRNRTEDYQCMKCGKPLP